MTLITNKTSYNLKENKIVNKCIITLLIISCASVLKTHGQLGTYCSGNSGDPIITENFGTGIGNNTLTSGTTTYIYEPIGLPDDGEYSITNGTIGNPYLWHETADHTPADVNGKALIVNAASTAGEFYTRQITGLCENTTYEFSAWFINLVSTNACGGSGNAIPINVRFEIRNGSNGDELTSGNTGNIEESVNPIWYQYGLVFNTGNQTSVILRIINNGVGGCGNDLAIDDIEFKSCGDSATIEDNLGNSALTLCSGETPYSLELTATPDGSVYSTPAYQWQESSNGSTWNNINGATGQDVTVSVAASRYYRSKIAEVASNLNNDQCISFSNEFQVTVTTGPVMPTTACWQTAAINPTTCTWIISGTQPAQPTNLECWETTIFNNTTCNWDINGTQPIQPTNLECWETVVFNDTNCTWDVSGTQPAQPTNLKCWETVLFNTTSCTWDLSGTQPVQPTLECWETIIFNNVTCTWNINGTQPLEPDPSSLECWEINIFNPTNCSWEISGVQPALPNIACYETAIFNDTTCSWDVNGTQPLQPITACWEIVIFNTTSCNWEVLGTQPLQPALECWETSLFNTTTCTWDIIGTQPLQPIIACWETATFNPTSCAWELTGTQPVEPDPSTLACGETAIFNINTCIWEVSGSPTIQPNIQCYETAIFNSQTCVWDISGTQPEQPTTDCWQTATFNEISCLWELSGNQPVSPILACGEVSNFNSTTCFWEVSGSPTEKPNTECFETALFNEMTCVWDISGTQPEQPVLECGETAIFDSVVCAWEISQNPTTTPIIECYESATYDNSSCSWIVTGSQPEEPALENWEIATFNTTSCTWDVSGLPTVAITEQSIYLCDGNQIVLEAITNFEVPGFIWNTGEITEAITIDSPGIYKVDIIKDEYTLETIIYNVENNEAPIIETIDSIGSEIIIITANSGDYLYSLDGSTFQSNNTFYDVEFGQNTIYVKIEGCNAITKIEHMHFDIPKFFTPNNDGINDTFNLSGIENYNTSEVAIFDRYGKLLRFSNNGSFEWDGTIGNKIFPSGDYWYRIIIEDHKISGHFTLKR